MGLELDDAGVVKLGAGEDWDSVVATAVAKNLAGIECLSAIPGSSGGAVVQNIGAYGQTLSDSIIQVSAIELATGKEKIFSREECEFGYRTSWFKKNPNQYIVTGFQMQLKPGGEATIIYDHVIKHFENKPTPSLAELREFIIRIRASKGYLIMAGYNNYATAGSYFKNPIVFQDVFEKIKPVFGEPGLNRYWETPQGVKLAAAFLIQTAGFDKGYTDGQVGISPKHSLSLINLGGASASDMKKFAEQIKAAVLKMFGVKLEEEILYIGKFN